MSRSDSGLSVPPRHGLHALSRHSTHSCIDDGARAAFSHLLTRPRARPIIRNGPGNPVAVRVHPSPVLYVPGSRRRAAAGARPYKPAVVSPHSTYQPTRQPRAHDNPRPAPRPALRPPPPPPTARAGRTCDLRGASVDGRAGRPCECVPEVLRRYVHRASCVLYSAISRAAARAGGP